MAPVGNVHGYLKPVTHTHDVSLTRHPPVTGDDLEVRREKEELIE
ncbi:hypothetical protein Tco_1126926, partial [Tanacetum coccineum]